MNKASQSKTKNARSFTVGRDAFAKISAVEGIHLTKEMLRDFQAFEQKDLSSKDRREGLQSRPIWPADIFHGLLIQ